MFALALLVMMPAAEAPALAQKAYFRVLIDEGSVVYIDGDKANMRGRTERTFQTPFLLQARYYYTFKIVYASGREISRRVYFQPGDSIKLDYRSEK